METLPMDDVRSSLEAGWQLPAYLYSDPSVFELERETIFRRGWVMVGFISRLANRGDYITRNIGGTPIVVTRGVDGALHGFVNACLHRLHPVAVGDGCSRILQCKYHGWTYNLDGTLKSAPRAADDETFDRRSMALPPVRVETLGNLVFVNADPDAPSLAEYLGDAQGRLAELDLDFGHWEHSGSFAYDVDANWKLFAENALECYHCLLVHRHTFAAAIATDPENYLCEDYANVFMQVAPIRQAPEAESRPEAELRDFRLVYFWPSTALSIDEYAVVATQLVPLAPKRCRFVVDVYARPGVDGAVLDSWMQMYDTTFNEDKVVVTAQQEGYDSGLIPRGRLLPPSEPSIAAFQRRTWEALAPVLDRR